LYRHQHTVIPRKLIDGLFAHEYASSKLPIKREILVTTDQVAALIDEPMTFIIDPAYIKLLRRFPALSEEELIAQTIKFANTGNSTAYLLLWFSVRMSEDDLADLGTVFAKHEASFPHSLIENDRIALRSGLAAIVAGDVTPRMHDEWRRRAEGLAVLPTFSDNGTVHFRYVVFEHFLLPPSPQLAYLQLLFLHTRRRGDLCRCKLERCGRFFLAARPNSDRKGERRGRTIRDYCPGSDHRDRAHRAAAVERVRRSRRERAKALAALNQRRRR
jgi:hypothetical protein